MEDFVFSAEIVNAVDYKELNKGRSKVLYFPTDTEKVKKTMELIGLPSDAGKSVYFFAYDFDDTGLPLPKDADINELNELALLIQGMSDYEKEVFYRAVEAKEHTRDVADLINLAHNTECYNIIFEMNSWEDVGVYFAEEAGVSKVNLGVLADYVDYEAYGKDYANQNGGYLLGDVFLETNCADFKIEYDGNIQNLPKDSIILETDADRQKENELEEASQLSIYINATLSGYDKEYRDLYDDKDEAYADLCDSLIKYETVHIKERLAKFDYPDARDCLNKIADFENKYAKDTFSLYQIKEGPDLHYHRFVSLDRLHRDGLEVERGNYDLVYTAKLNKNDTPESLFERFNLNRDKHFSGHSMSISDILVIKRNGEEKAYYCDRVGFKEVPEFFNDRNTERTTSAEHTSTKHTRTTTNINIKNNNGILVVGDSQEKDGKKPSVRHQLAIIARIKRNNGDEPDKKPPERSI